MQIDAFHRGDMEALAEAVDASIPEVWRLARTGFVTSEEGREAYVRGVESIDVTERLVARTLARCYSPERRKQIESEEALRRCELDEARVVLIEHAIRTGSMATLADDSDRALVAEETKGEVLGIGSIQHRDEMSSVVETELSKMDERTRKLVALRFGEGKTAKESASAFGCGAAAIGSHERRIRHRIRHALRAAFPEEKFGAATIDALLSKESLPAITRERIRREVLKRTFQDEPAPFAIRMAWALGTLSFAVALWLLMFLDVLPYYEDDVAPAPRVEVKCNPTCKIRVLAPRDARRVAIGVTQAGKSEALLTSPTGRSIRLPLGAAVRTVDIPYTAELPRTFDRSKPAWAVAVFSEDRLNRDQILSLTDGRISLPGVFTTSAALSLE